LTKSTGLTKGAIYGNFKDKNEIALEAFDLNVKKVVDELMARVFKSDDAIEMLLAVADFFLENAADFYKRGGCPIVNAAVDSDDINVSLNRKVKEKVEGLRIMLAKITRAGIDKGVIVSSLQPDSFASVAISMIEGGSLLSKATGDMEYLKNSIGQLKAQILSMRKR
jgi:AcrR family transcriptional regulator